MISGSHTITLLVRHFDTLNPSPTRAQSSKMCSLSAKVGYDVSIIVIIYVKCYKPAEIITITTTTTILIIIIIILIRLNLEKQLMIKFSKKY